MEPAPSFPGGVAVLLRAPRLGQVKSRLAASLGEEAALNAYRRLLTGTLRTLAPLRRVRLCVTPDSATGEVEALRRPDWMVAPQGPGDLGERLHRAFLGGFAQHPGPWLAIGTDCPEFTLADLDAGWRALESASVVLGPASDGGYWILGLRAPQPELFRNIPWGGPAVFRRTAGQAAALGLRVSTLRVLRDVDTAEDWQALHHLGFLAPDKAR